MPVWRLQASVWNDSTLPRDAMTITPHFNDAGVGTDPQGLCEDLAEGLNGYYSGVVGGRQITVKAYDAQGTAPVYPQGEATLNLGAAPPSYMPREIAVCLSFFSERNIPRRRGRLYVPMAAIPTGTAGLDGRPGAGTRGVIAQLAPILQGLGGADVDWCVFSRMDGVARPVTDWWVDDEWDTIRSRGLRPTTRTTGTTSEG
jgi:hypothetical protein